MTAGTRRVLMTVLVATVWAGAGRAVWRLWSSPVWKELAVDLSERERPLHVDSLVQVALKPAPAPAVVQFDAARESPFLPEGTRRVPANAAAVSPARPREPIYLSGVLLRTTKPQAILEDARGMTHICGEGDSVFGQFVVRIERDQVTLRDRRGSYTVRVKE